MSKRPRTREELRALPEGGGFGSTMDGGVRVPVMKPEVVVGCVEPDDVIMWWDEGCYWSLGCYVDGTWFKRRCM